MPAVLERLRSLWQRLRRRPRRGDDDPEDPWAEPALVGRPPRGPRPSLAAEAEPPEPYDFDDHADHPRSIDD
jgi:hypothetical protein